MIGPDLICCTAKCDLHAVRLVGPKRPELFAQQYSLVYTYDASISISTSISTRMFTRAISISISTRNPRVNRCDASISALCLRLCLCLRRPGLHVRRNDASISTSTSTREWNDFYSLVLVLMLASLRPTCKPGRRKHKHKRKERKLKNSDKLSAYNLVTHALPFSAMLESNLGCFCACVCHVMLMLIARVNILVLVLVLILMLASYV